MKAIELHLDQQITVGMESEDGFCLDYFRSFAAILDTPLLPALSAPNNPAARLLRCDALPPSPAAERWQMTLVNRRMHVEGGGTPANPHGPFYLYLPPQAEPFLMDSPGFQYALYLQALLLEVLKGAPFLLTHGALAVNGKQAVLCTGPSGIGKSTLMERLPCPWTSPADDLTLLSFHDNKTRIHPLPTWSQWYNNGKILSRPVCSLEQHYELSGVVVLARGEQDRCCDISRQEAVQAINSAFADGAKMLRWLLPKLDLKPFFNKGFEQSFQLLQNYPVKKFELQRSDSPCNLFKQLESEWKLSSR